MYATSLFLTTFCLFWAIIINAEKPERTTGMVNVNDCQEEYNITMETWTYFVDNYMTLPDENNENHRCFVQCLMEKRKMLLPNKDKEFNRKAAMKEFTYAAKYMNEIGRGKTVKATEEEFEDCLDIAPGGGKCMQNYLILKCLQAVLKKAFDD